VKSSIDIHRHYAYNSIVTKDEFKRLRAKAGHTQASLAKEMGVHLRTVTRWEIGEVAVPRVVELALQHIVEHTKKKAGM
jgi:DNA-binding transcriptional regulator YiaG